MLKHAPYQVPSGEDEGRNREAESGLHTLHIQTGGISVSAKEDSRGGVSRVSSPRGKKRAASEDLETEVPRQGKKRAASEDLETEVSKRGKKPSPGGPAPEGVLTVQRPQGGQPSTEL